MRERGREGEGERHTHRYIKCVYNNACDRQTESQLTCVKQEQEKVLQIKLSDTIVYPTRGYHTLSKEPTTIIMSPY